VNIYTNAETELELRKLAREQDKKIAEVVKDLVKHASSAKNRMTVSLDVQNLEQFKELIKHFGVACELIDFLWVESMEGDPHARGMYNKVVTYANKIANDEEAAKGEK